MTEARVLHVSGVVQGVGFRPFVHRLAQRHGLAGAVRNASGEVEIEIEGPVEKLEAFQRELISEAPPLSRIDHLEWRSAAGGRQGFRIAESRLAMADRRLPVPPDTAMCADCERELLDPRNRRYRYPFITCTDCGPRYTVIDTLPFDRARTSMRPFTPCLDCQGEYGDPDDRRYHCETTSCARCGPRLWLEPADSSERDPILAAAGRLASGAIVAIRGLGGFHLAADATDGDAVQRLRDRKQRDAKPLAVMVATLADARAIADVGSEEAELLESPERPIVLLRSRAGGPLAAAVAPGLDTVGVMLAYTPLHRLVLDAVRRPLVMTSGNLSDEPIATDVDDARRRLHRIADAFLLHDRDIVARYDDSLARVVNGAPLVLRRARGYAPLPVRLPCPSPQPLIAMGAELKNTFTLAVNSTAYLSQHIGDLQNVDTLDHFTTAVESFKRLFRIVPRVAVSDLHPDYLSTRVADESGLPVMKVQHHHAHIAAVLGEHGVTGPVLGLAFDGTGYGPDGCIWGCEFLIADVQTYRRVGRLRYAPLAGGDRAARQPWRAAAGYLALEPQSAATFAAAFTGIAPAVQATVSRQLAARVNAPLASSMGRLFDAAAAILGVRRESQYEGQAAMELEALAADRPAPALPFPMRLADDGIWTLDPLPLLTELGCRFGLGGDVRDLAATFHESVAAGASQLAAFLAGEAGLKTVALGGGCFQNARLLASVREQLRQRGLEVLIPRQLPPNDGAVSYGQAVNAAARLAAGEDPCV